jgi:GT2 family glycosyltransferase
LTGPGGLRPAVAGPGLAGEWIFMDVIIPTKNRPSDLRTTLKSISRQEQRPKRVVVVDQSELGVPDLVAVESELRGEMATLGVDLVWLRPKTCSGLTQARNIGVQYAVSGLVCFLDDDVELLPGFFAGMADAFRDPSVIGVGGVVREEGLSDLSYLGSRVFGWGIFRDDRLRIRREASSGRLTAPVPSRTLSGGAMAFRSDVLRIHPFDERLVGYSLGEDVEYTLRLSALGHHLIITPHATLVHKRSPLGRYTASELVEANICFKCYLLARARQLGIGGLVTNLVFLVILLAGSLLSAFLLALSTKSVLPLIAYARGLAKSSCGFRGVPFISAK